MADVWKAGEFNLWWHQSNLGLPLFAAYQPLPAMVMGAVIAVLGEVVAPVVLFKFSILLCWVLMPFAWYRGARAYGLSTLMSVVLGLLTLTIHDPYNIGLGIRSSTFRGLYTQHFGLLFLPLFVGQFKRYLNGGRCSALQPATLFALTAMSHLWVGLYAAIMAATMLIVSRDDVLVRVRKTAAVGVFSSLLLAWWLVPLILTNDYAGGLPWMREMHNGWPWRTTAERFWTGDIFDYTRWPLLTVLVTLGSMVLVRRFRDLRVQHWLLLTAVTMALFLGRTNLGEAYNLVPLHGQVNVMRYLTGVHICGIIAAAAAITASVSTMTTRWTTWSRYGLAVAGAGFIAVAVGDAAGTLKAFDTQEPYFSELVSKLSTDSGHRFAVHRDLGTGSHFHRDLLPALTKRGQLQSYAHGYHCTLSTFYAEYFDFSPAACRLFNVDTIVSRGPVPQDFPEDAYSDSWSNGVYTTFHIEEDEDLGLFSFVNIQGSVSGPDLRAIREAVKVLSIPAFSYGVLPAISTSDTRDAITVTGADGVERPWSTDEAMLLLKTLTTAHPTGAAKGEVISSSQGLASYSATVRGPKSGRSWLVLKVNMFPWWHAHLDDEPVSITHVAPNFMAIAIPSGTHNVTFQYINPPFQKYLALISVGVFAAWGLACIRRRRQRGGP